ncbi:MAG: type IV pilus assembly protein PilM [Candidatus Ancaeobacter aquaticus]|nr:type IV pilus assembly protein PilM [Candidatus Ancaeobacter aquaticus]
MFLYQNRIIGLDIGESALKIVELEKKSGEVRLLNYEVIECDDGLGKGLTDDDRQNALLEKLTKFVDSKIFRNNSCIVGISGQAVFIRFVKLPVVEKRKMDQIVQYEAQQQVPFPIEEVRWDYQLLGNGALEERDILLVAIKQDIVRTLVESVYQNGLMPEVIDVLPLSLYNCFAYNGLLTDEASLVVDIGARTTNLIVTGGDELWIRSIPIAGNSLTQCIVDDMKISEPEAENLKRSVGFGQGEIPELRGAIERGASRLFAEISRSLGYYKSQFGGTPIKKVFITGGGSKLKNIEEALSERFKMPVEKFDPLQKITGAVKDEQKAGALTETKHLLANAIGLGLRGITRTELSVNLIPSDILKQRGFVKKFAYYVVTFIVILLTLFSVRVCSTKIARANIIRAKDLSSYISYIEVLNTHFKKINDGVAVINNKLNMLNELIYDRDLWLRIFIEIQNVMAPNIWIENISSNLEELKVETKKNMRKRKGRNKGSGDKAMFEEVSVVYLEGKGRGSIEKDIPLFQHALEKSPLFKDVEIVSAELRNSLISFVIRLKLQKKQ